MTAGASLPSADARAVVLVEGLSDRFALEALAERRGRDLAAEGVAIVSMGGATNLGSFLRRYGPTGLNLTIAGLGDEGEARVFRRSLQRVGLGPATTAGELAQHGFYLCSVDLEDELIRALGVDVVVEILEAEGDLGAFRTFQQQPDQREKPDGARLRRFMGTHSGRKIHYAPVLVRALELHRVPQPLDAVLTHV